MTTEEFIAARKRLGLTQSELANKLGLSLRGIQKLESGESKVRKIHEIALLWLSFDGAVERTELLDPVAFVNAVLTLERRGYTVTPPPE